VRVAYIVSRFPVASETFILREMGGVDGREGIELSLHALFPPSRPFVHPLAERWMGRVHRVSAGRAAAACLWWTARRPAALPRCALALIWAYRRRPGMMARALVTLSLAAAHARQLLREETEHVHAHFATYPAITAWICRRLTGLTYSFTAHAHDIFVDRSFLEPLIREASFVATISEFNRSYLTPYAARSRTPIHLVRCGIEPGAYSFRARTLPRSGPIEALCVASFEEYKGHRVLLDAMAREGEVERVRLTLVGAGRLERALRSQVWALGLGDRVSIVGSKSETEVAALLEAADAFVLASIVAADGQMEGIPVALMEALACGVPTVATRLSGIPELVQDGVTGLLATPGDAADLAHALERLLEDESATRGRAAAGRELVEREFSLGRSAERMRQLFLGLAAAPDGVLAPREAGGHLAGLALGDAGQQRPEGEQEPDAAV